jgi:integrase
MKWISTQYKGVRYREHESRKHGVKKDRYYAIRYQRDGKRIEEGLGWTTELDPKDKKHWTAEKAAIVLAELKEAARGLEKGPTRLREKRNIEDERKEAEKTEQERLEKEAVTFDAFFTDTYLPQATADKKSRSVTREEGLFKVWISPAIGHLPLKTIMAFHLEKLKKTMADKVQSPRSVEYALSVIRQVFNTARRLGAFEGENPTANVKFPKPDNGRMRFLTRGEADKLLKSLKVKSADVHDMTLLSLHAGLRFGEIASLTWQDIDLGKSVLTIRDAKAGSRYAFLTEQAAAMLKARTEGKPSEYVFQGRNGKLDRLSLSFFRSVEELKLNEGIDDPRLQICFHSCRHSYASWLIDQGADLYTVQKLLGHKTNVMTQRYAHLSENRLRDAAMALGAAWTKQEPTEEGGEEAGEVVNGKK